MRYEFQIWRFITPVALHASFQHIAMNMVAQLIIGSSLERTIQWKRTALLYFGSAFGGILFSSLLSNSLSVGASTAIFGMIGSQIGYLLKNWKGLDSSVRCNFLIFIFIFLVMNIMIASAVTHTSLTFRA